MGFVYDSGRQAFLEGGIAWLTDNIIALLIDAGTYTASQSADHHISDIPSAAIVKRTGNLAAKTSTGGVADAGDISFTSVSAASPTCEAVVLAKNTGTDSTSQLIAYIDSATGLPYTPNGGDALVSWDNGANKIFKL